MASEAPPRQIRNARMIGMIMPIPCRVISQRRLSTRSATHPPIRRNSSSGNCPTIWVMPKLPGD